MGVIPANTQLQTALAVRAAGPAQKAHVELSICTPNGRVSAARLLLRMWPQELDQLCVCSRNHHPGGADLRRGHL